MKRLVIFGAEDLARTAWFYFTHDSEYEVAGFTVHERYLKANELMGLPVVPFENLERVYPPEDFDCFIGIGFKRLNKARAEIYGCAKQKGYRLATYISSRAVCWGKVACGDNCFILENNVIQPFVQIGSNVTLWSGNHIGHDVEIRDHCFLSSQVVLSGRVCVGEYSFIGVNACVKQGVVIGAGCLIGSGAVILKNTAPGSVYLAKGTPAAPVTAAQVESML